MATLESIQARIETLQAKANALVAKQSDGALQKIHELMTQYGLTIADIESYGGSRKQSARAKSAQKSTVAYQDPKTGATWSGRGRAPGWIANAKNRSKFAVNGAATESKAGKANAASKSKNKRAGKLRGPQPAMYRDPQSGATWSGRGRAPGWLASVKDRSAFLIG